MSLKIIRVTLLLPFLVILFALRVQPSGGIAPSEAVVSIRLLPADVTLWGPHGSQHFIVLGRYADGLERDVTTHASFSLSDQDKGAIDARGKFTASSSGKVVLTAAVGHHSARTSIQIASGVAPSLTFAHDIDAILTKRGCNDTACHGSVKGRGGFKLSVYGLVPRDDYKYIVEGGTFRVLTPDVSPKNPRINLKEPEKSLLLLKPTFTLPHGGGVRFAVGSEDYATLLNWIKSGAPYGDEEEKQGVKVERVEVTPKEIVLDSKGHQQLIVTAYLANGSQEDFTDRARYVSQDSSIVDVTDDGLIKAKKPGESNVFVRVTGGNALSTTVGVVDHPIPNYPKLATRNYIDEYVFAKLRRFQILPSEPSTDEEFLRRACLDLTGTLPPPKRVREFLADKEPRKRDRLIDALLDSPEWVDYWTFRYSDLLRAAFLPTNDPQLTAAYQDWVAESILANKPYDQIARERIAAQGYSAPARNFYRYTEFLAPEIIMPEVVRVFWGRRIECAQCHNHPFETWTQNQFWGFAAFFGGMTELLSAHVVVDVLGGNHVDQPREMTVINPRTKEKVVPAFLQGMKLPRDQWMDPRMRFAEGIISHPFFAEAAVNRVWSCFFGRGVVDPVDDFRSTNPPTHPELLEALAKDFKESGYDLKHLMRVIAQSRTYQLSGTPLKSNENDQIDYSHALPRPLDAAVLLDAITSTTGVPEKLEYHTLGGVDHLPIGTRAMQVLPDICPSQFMDAFGRSMRNVLPAGSPEPNLLEALDMLAGPAYTSRIVREGGRLDKLLTRKASDEQIIENFYLAALARFPTAEEKDHLLAFLSQRSSDRPQTLAGLVWAIISSREFAYNH